LLNCKLLIWESASKGNQIGLFVTKLKDVQYNYIFEVLDNVDILQVDPQEAEVYY